MAYNDQEIGAATGQPIELYKFIGTNNNYFLTSYVEAITSAGQEYTPFTISRNKLKVSTQNQREAALEVKMPFDHPLVAEYAYQNAPPSLVLEIIRAHDTDHEDTVTLWKGRVTAFAVEGRVARLKVPSLFSYVLSGNTPTPRFQAPCNHVLYDASTCGVNPALNQHVTTIASVVGTAIALTTLPFGDGEAIGGVLITATGEQRMVVDNLGTSVTVTYAFSAMGPGDPVTIRKGCDHSIATCLSKFNNKDRYGGFAVVPARNPFTSTLE